MKIITFLTFVICCLFPFSALSESPPLHTFRDIPFNICTEEFLECFNQDELSFKELWYASDLSKVLLVSTTSIDAFGYEALISGNFMNVAPKVSEKKTLAFISLDFVLESLPFYSDALKAHRNPDNAENADEKQREFYAACVTLFVNILHEVEAAYGPMKGGAFYADGIIYSFPPEALSVSYVDAAMNSKYCDLVFRNDNLLLFISKNGRSDTSVSFYITLTFGRESNDNYRGVRIPNTIEEEAMFTDYFYR